MDIIRDDGSNLDKEDNTCICRVCGNDSDKHNNWINIYSNVTALILLWIYNVRAKMITFL